MADKGNIPTYDIKYEYGHGGVYTTGKLYFYYTFYTYILSDSKCNAESKTEKMSYAEVLKNRE